MLKDGEQDAVINAGRLKKDKCAWYVTLRDSTFLRHGLSISGLIFFTSHVMTATLLPGYKGDEVIDTTQIRKTLMGDNPNWHAKLQRLAQEIKRCDDRITPSSFTKTFGEKESETNL